MKAFKYLSLCLTLALSSYGQNLLDNANFDAWEGELPRGWSDRSKQEYRQIPNQGGMQVGIVKSQGRSGELLQKVPVESGKRYAITGEIRGSNQGLGFIQVKLFANGKELNRMQTRSNSGGEWELVERSFRTDGVDEIQIILRWKQDQASVGHTLGYRQLHLEKILPLTHEGAEVPPHAVPTFNSIGLYWKPTGGNAERAVTTSYRKKGADEWRAALPLWFDQTVHPESVAVRTAEYRGSIVHLDAGTSYEVRLQLEDGLERIIEVDTWSDDFKIARRVELPARSKDVYEITEGGSEATGYVLYEAPDGAYWDAQNEADCNVKVSASWVIVRGLTMTGAKRHGIVLGDVKHVVIEQCDISGWGATGSDGQAVNFNSAISSGSEELEYIVIQDCELHHPRSDSNSWKEKRPGSSSYHPQGPQAITFMKGQGVFVIRRNRIYSDMEHMFNDGMGEYRNSSFGGFPHRDSDIYDNYISHCWDDALEIEGANRNVRVWNNYIDMSYGAIGSAATSLGPVYYFRNVYAVSRKHTGADANSFRGHYLVKLGSRKTDYTKGSIFVFHNTALQPIAPSSEWPDPSAGAQAGVLSTDKRNHQENMTTRNNILQLRKDSDFAVRDYQKTLNNDFDYDLYTGRIQAKTGSESHGISANPLYERAPDGRLWLAPGTLGHDAGAVIPNFNDDYAGAAPDMGAVETNSQRAKPALWPDFPENYYPSASTDAPQNNL